MGKTSDVTLLPGNCQVETLFWNNIIIELNRTVLLLFLSKTVGLDSSSNGRKKKQNSGQPVTRINYEKRNVNICHETECIVFIEALAPSLQTIQKIIWFYWKVARLTSKILQIILTIAFMDIGITTTSMLDKNRKNPAYKTFRTSLLAKQAVTAGSSSLV